MLRNEGKPEVTVPNVGAHRSHHRHRKEGLPPPPRI
jgi:hypothetical protein